MNPAAHTLSTRRRGPVTPLALLGGAAAVAALAGLGLAVARADWTELSRAALILQLHLSAAIAAVIIGAVLMAGVKGRGLHKPLGWAWVACMATVAVSSFWIRTGGGFSWIHALSGWTMIALPMAVAAVKRRDLKAHRKFMSGLFYGGLLTAGAFAFVPGRILFRAFFG